jgi:ethanolamine permease
MISLIIGATLTWFVCSSLIDAGTLGSSVYPLYDAALATGMPIVICVLFLGTILSCLASANGCVNDASRAWFAMSRDKLIPGEFAKVHPKYKTPYRAILFLMPISLAFGYTGLLDQVISFSILSAILVYILMAYMMFKFRRMYPLGYIKRGYVAPWHPIPAIVLLVLSLTTLFGMFFGYWVNLMAGFIFYFLASLWFTLHRYRFLDEDSFLAASEGHWPCPKKY